MAKTRIISWKEQTARKLAAFANRLPPAENAGVRPLADPPPVRPCRTQIVEAADSEPNGDGLYAGAVQVVEVGETYDEADSFDDGADCWIALLNASAGSGSGDEQPVATGDRFIGWRVGQVISDGEETARPLFVVQLGGSGSGGTRLFDATADEDFDSDDSDVSITGLTSLSAADAPSGVTSVKNRRALYGNDGDGLTLVEDTSGETAVYYILQVDHAFHDCPEDSGS